MLLPNHNHPSGRKWILPLREGLGHFNQVPAIERGLQGSYAIIDAMIRKTLLALPAVAEVQRRGPTSLVPGVSDLDYRIRLKHNRWRDILTVGQTYRRLKKALVLPGEAILEYPGFPKHPGLSQWPHQGHYSARGKAILAHQWYYLAIEHLWFWKSRSSPLYLQRAHRLFTKIGDLSEDLPRTQSQSWQELWHHVRDLLPQLAQAALDEPGPETPTKLYFRPGLDPKKYAEGIGESTPWENIRSATHYTLEDLLHELSTFPRPVLSLAPVSCQLIAAGLHWGPVDGHLTQKAASRYKVPAGVLASHTVAAAWLKGWTYSALLPGELLWKSPSQLRSTLVSLLRVRMNLVTGTFGYPYHSVLKRLPATHGYLREIFETVHNDRPMVWEDWVRIGSQLAEEFQSTAVPLPTPSPSVSPT